MIFIITIFIIPVHISNICGVAKTQSSEEQRKEWLHSAHAQ